MTAPLNLPVSATALVTVDTARAVRGVDCETLLAEIEDGRIAWAFNIAAPGSTRRELRILAASLAGQDAQRPARQVIDDLIGTHRPTLRGAEIERLLVCSAQLVKQLHEAGELSGEVVASTRRIARASLADFLHRRRIGV